MSHVSDLLSVVEFLTNKTKKTENESLNKIYIVINKDIKRLTAEKFSKKFTPNYFKKEIIEKKGWEIILKEILNKQLNTKQTRKILYSSKKNILKRIGLQKYNYTETGYDIRG